MGNKWIDHVKKYAQEHNLTYACALSQPDIKNKKSYKIKQKTKSGRKFKNNENSKYRIFKK